MPRLVDELHVPPSLKRLLRKWAASAHHPSAPGRDPHWRLVPKVTSPPLAPMSRGPAGEERHERYSPRPMSERPEERGARWLLDRLWRWEVMACVDGWRTPVTRSWSRTCCSGRSTR